MMTFDLGNLLGNIGSAFIGGMFNMIGANQTNSLNRAMFNANMNFQEKQADLNRTFQNDQRLAQNGWNELMFDRQNQWNSPSNQVQLLRDAGINPSAVYAGASASPVGSTSAPSAVSGGSGAMPSAVSVPQMQNPFSAFANISQVIKDLADASKSGAETKRLNSLLPQEVENYILKNKDLEYSNQLKSYDAYVAKNIKDARVRSAWQELTNLQLKAMNTQSESDLNKAKAASERLGQLLTDEDVNLRKSQVVEMGIRNRNLQRAFDSQFEVAKSEQAKNYAYARDLSASAEGKELLNNVSRATNLYDIDNALYRADTIDLLRNSVDKEKAYQELVKSVKLSSAYKNSDVKLKVDVALENLAKIIGLNTSVSVSK